MVFQQLGNTPNSPPPPPFSPSQPTNTYACRLDAKKTCNFYDLRSGDTITFKKKHRPIKIALIDGSTKTILVDDSNLVTDMIAVICSHINIPNSEEYGLRGPDQADHEWLNPQQTLREQGIVDSDVIILRKRFFYSDANVDTTDPYALNLLYQECREAIIMGRYPCNENEATQFAALQCQVTLGNNNPQRHKPGYLSLSEYVPEEYRRAGKKLEKKVYVEHRKLLNMTEVNAKYRYVQLCRSLTTYGVTFFHVEEQLVDARGKKKKGKVVARLLGITRDKVGGFCVRVLCFACVGVLCFACVVCCVCLCACVCFAC